MKGKDSGTQRTLSALRKAALGHSDVVESVACKGTAIESASFKVNGKAFLFLRPAAAMLKLEKSHGEASKREAEAPGLLKVGSGGWTTIALSGPQSLPSGVIEKWIAESYGLFAGVKVTKGAKRTSR